MDLEGNVIKRLGRAHDGSGYGEFEEPTEIAITHHHVFMLDARGMRIHVPDRDGNRLGRFPLPHSSDGEP